MDKEIKAIKRQISEIFAQMGVPLKSIILFGSRARGNFKTDSDWDFLIVLGKKASREEKVDIAHRVRKGLAAFYVPCDVLIKSEEEIQERKNVIGSVIRGAVKEGIKL